MYLCSGERFAQTEMRALVWSVRTLLPQNLSIAHSRKSGHLWGSRATPSGFAVCCSPVASLRSKQRESPPSSCENEDNFGAFGSLWLKLSELLWAVSVSMARSSQIHPKSLFICVWDFGKCLCHRARSPLTLVRGWNGIVSGESSK